MNGERLDFLQAEPEGQPSADPPVYAAVLFRARMSLATKILQGLERHPAIKLITTVTGGPGDIRIVKRGDP